MSKVTVIIPVYHVPYKYLKTCIESVMSQTLKDIEILLIDDGSKDDCGLICSDYAKQDMRIRVIHKANEGVCATRNLGIRLAKSDWITFVDGDDWLDENFCMDLWSATGHDDVDVVCGGMKRVQNEKVCVVPSSYEYGYTNDSNLLIEKLWEDHGGLAYLASKLFKRDVLLANNIMFNETLGQGAEDMAFVFQVFLCIEGIYILKDPYYYYRYNTSSSSIQTDEKKRKIVLDYYAWMEAQMEDNHCLHRRMLYTIVHTLLKDNMNPQEQMVYLNHPMAQKGLHDKRAVQSMGYRRIILWLAKHQMYRSLWLCGWIRRLLKKEWKNDIQEHKTVY